MANIITIDDVQQLVLWPQEKATASVTLMSGEKPIVKVMAAEGGAWGNAIIVKVTHNAATWNLSVIANEIEQEYTELDTSLGVSNLSSAVSGVIRPFVGFVKVGSGRPDIVSAQMSGGQDERKGLDLSVLVRKAQALLGATRPSFTRNIEELLNAHRAAGSVWSEFDQKQQDDFLASLLAAINARE